jgi:hypothetical protein
MVMDERIGNQFWKLRSKHGRDVIFDTPQKLWDAACEYFEVTDRRKWTKKDWVGKDAMPVTRETDTPYTLRGMCIFLDVNSGYWSEFKQSDKAKAKDFSEIITRIEDVIYNQKFEGASVGAFNASIIARDLGLKEQTDITTQGDKVAPVISVMVDGQIIDGEMK